MTDNDLIAKLETYVALQRERPNEPMAIPDLAAEAAVVLRARDTELATARTERDEALESATIAAGARAEAEAELVTARAVTAKLLDGYYRLPGADGNWWREPVDGRGSPIHEPVTDAERAWLASVSPPADREDEDDCNGVNLIPCTCEDVETGRGFEDCPVHDPGPVVASPPVDRPTAHGDPGPPPVVPQPPVDSEEP